MLEYNFCNESYWEQIKRGIIQSVPVILSDGSGETYNNWLKICLSMKAAGYTREEVNEWCGAEEFDISRWNGLEPKSTCSC